MWARVKLGNTKSNRYRKTQIRQKVTDKRVLRIIRTYLKTGIMIDGKMERREKDVPQGSPLSPLLANIYLDKLDKELEKHGLSFCRYADDITLYTRSDRSAKRILESLILWIEKHLKLSVNPNKSGTDGLGTDSFWDSGLAKTTK